MSAAGLLESGQCDGVWLVFSAWSPELALDIKGQPVSDSTCVAVALGLVSQPAVTNLGRVRIDIIDDEPSTLASAESSSQDSFSLTAYLADERRKTWTWSCHPSPWMRLKLDLALADLPKPHFSMRGGEQTRTVARPSQPAQASDDANPPV